MLCWKGLVYQNFPVEIKNIKCPMRVKATNILNNKNRHDIVQLIYATEFVLPKISDSKVLSNPTYEMISNDARLHFYPFEWPKPNISLTNI